VDNTLFYTLSTIAQTLAAAIALLGALVLYRLQRISDALTLAMGQVTQPYSLSPEAQLSLEEERYAEVLEFLNTAQPHSPVMVATAPYHDRRRRAEALISLQHDLRRRLKESLALTVVVIGAAVAGIALVPCIVSTAIGPTLTLLLGVGAFVLCLVVYGFLALRTVL
jgi:hypothetical protein